MALGVVIPRRCGAARMRIDRRGDVVGGGEAAGVDDLAGCLSDKSSGTEFYLVSDIGVPPIWEKD